MQGKGTLEAENWLRGRWKLSGDVGECAVWISLTPTVPPHVQSMRITSTMPPSASMQQAIDALAALITHPTRRAFAKLTASKADRTRLWDRIRIANILLGPCSVGEVTAGDGEISTSVRMLGEKRNSVAEIQLTARGKILDVLFQAEES